jgi:hypothetical protein
MALSPHALARRTVDELTIEDERSFRHVAIYADLKEVLRRAKYPFRVLDESLEGHADRALLLNLTFWGADAGGDVLDAATLPADVVAHAAWHHLAVKALPAAAGQGPSVDSLFLGEAIASAFDVFLVGRLIGHAPRSSFLETQVPAMAATAEAAGLDEDGFQAMLEGVVTDPERAFADLRELLFDATSALFACHTVEDASQALALHDGHRFASLLHRYELSNWVLYARAYGSTGRDERARAIDAKLRSEARSLDWLAAEWIAPALA